MKNILLPMCFILLFQVNGLAQDLNINVSGVVTDEDSGLPIPTVNVVEKGTSNGVMTDFDGNFNINVPEDAVLVFSFIGYSTKEISVQGQEYIEVSMKEEASALNEVVLIGYGTQKKKNLTGAISSIETEDIVLTGGPDIGNMIKGKAAGLTIRQNSAQPGGGLDIMIRGAGSINASNDPLIVVDGFPITDLEQPDTGGRYDAGTQSILNTFNPNDIESIEVLKDASATSIYGSRAANGVILITTKRGAEGRPTVQYSVSTSFQPYSSPFDVLPLNEWMEVRNEAAWEHWLFTNNVSPWGERSMEEAESNPVAGQFQQLYTQNAINNVGKGTDWVDLVTRDGMIEQHNISLSGGSESFKYRLSGNYYDQEGVVKNSALTRYTIRGNLDQTFNEYLKLGFNISTSRIDNENSSLGGGMWENSGIIRAAMQQGPHILAIDEDGNYPLNPQLSQQPNPYSLLTITDRGRIERTMINSLLDITPIDGLLVRLKAGVDRGVTDRWSYIPKTTLHGALEDGRASISEVDNNHYLLEATANYNREIGDGHNFDLLVGVSEEHFKDASNSSGNTGFITDAFLWNNLNAGTGTRSVSSYGQERMIASYFSRLNYNFKERYLATFTVRTDGSSVFAENNKWATFPSGAFAWNISEEPFMQNIDDVVSHLKLRFSYGETGNASIGSNAFAAYSAYPAYLSGEDVRNIGVSLARLENPDLKWETTTEANFGIDYGFFDNRINGSVEVYHRIISDLLATKPLNSYHEINTVIANIGETESKGLEITVNTHNIKSLDFQWKSTFTFGSFKDNWRERADDWKPAVYQNEDDPIRAIYSRISDGIMQEGEEVPAQPNLQPGMIKIVDFDGFVRDDAGNPVVDENGRFLRTGAPDGMIDEADTKLIGTSDPDFMIGFSNVLNYKNFDLKFDFNGMFGRKMADPNYTAYGVSAEPIYTYGYNALRTVKDRWTPENPSTTQPSSYYGWSEYGSGDFFLEDAWFIRLQNVSLGYDLPQTWFGGVFEQARIHVDGQNLFVITPYGGIDPETDSYTAAYPNVRTFTLGANFTF
ncbi:SusC/RagA family TonB-linked outer membrane protein [Salegentibacter flavus]|uniref:TonB-linked outer membrane protein, SusC/RagA family n=1 Tax=Salegentibacter flavus TaxID=287099 RepID=A0A1I4ZK18_9FLAO|nr:TonB-dependent receptor [Salegentibacter flavus]SFN50290.1 TonB-linked outer membrane protein, SusC/RagA family [Salegentibacter flavus]